MQSFELMMRWLKRLAITLGGIVGLVLALVATLNLISVVRQQRIYSVPIATPAVVSDASAIDRGRHLVTAVSGCTDCHGSDLGAE